jgi:hypothetical protein
MTDKHLEEAERLWIPLLQGSEEEDEYWNWVNKQRRESLLPGAEFYAIECEDMTQGLLAIDTLKKRCQIDWQYRQRLVYIIAIATAPWNRPLIQDPPTYKKAWVGNWSILRSDEAQNSAIVDELAFMHCQEPWNFIEN